MNPQPPYKNSLPRDLSPWKWSAWGAMVIGGYGLAKGANADLWHLQFAWLSGFIFLASITLGTLFLLLIHHVFDNAWSSPLRRLLEQIAGMGVAALCFIFPPLLLFAPSLYPWLWDVNSSIKHPYWLFVGVSLACLGFLTLIASRLFHWSLRQDKSGMARCTHALRRWSILGLFVLAATLTVASLLWVKAITPGWSSAIYPLWLFAASVWGACAVIYLLAWGLRGAGVLPVVGNVQFHRLGTLLFAFTLFHAYIAYSQYLVIWHANIPAETGWYRLREIGSWKTISLVLILGHFALPFLLLLGTRWKLKPAVMVPLCLWVCVMHYGDIQFQIMPAAHPAGFPFNRLWIDASCLSLITGVAGWLFLRSFTKHPAYCLRDPRMAEAMGSHIPPTTLIATAPEQANDD